jgi:Putative beta-barrel porin-2, OmpL-like. bbp2
MSVFLLICGVSLLFFVVFLVQCSRPRRASGKAPVVRKVAITNAVDSAAGRRTLIHLEQQMAEFLSSHGRSFAALLLAVGSVATAAQMKAQSSAAPASAPSAADEQVSPAVQKQLDAMQKRIEQLEAELNSHNAQGQPNGAAANNFATAHSVADQAQASQAAEGSLQQGAVAEKKGPPDPFSFADFTWLNGNSRVKELPFDSKFFTPEIRFDVGYAYSYNHPKDDTIDGSAEVFRHNEFQLTQLGVGGDFHYDNVMGRVMTQVGMYSQTQPRNDASPARGQWALDGAYRYLAEAYAGYHINKMDGINIQAGIFMSYIGLFSWYNFDNWAYQPSYVSSNTPFFFNGLRVQIFPNQKLKIEPWLINGWQSYGRFNSRPGLGFQVLYRPTGNISIVSNGYGIGEDTLGVPGRVRYHSDNSFQWMYYQNHDRTLDRMAFSLTGDIGCEHGGGVSCAGDSAKGPKQDFLGFMIYNRFWFLRDRYALTLGGGKINNPGRYVVLLPPINGATAASGTPYFTQNPGDPFKAWDASATVDYMPSQYITFRWEFDHRAASVPYFSGPGGITPQGGNTGCAGCVVPGFTPDLRKIENRLDLALMVMF